MLPQLRSFLASIAVTLIAATAVLALAGAVRMAHTAGNNPRDALRIGTAIDSGLDRNPFYDPEQARLFQQMAARAVEQPLQPIVEASLPPIDLDDEPPVTDSEPIATIEEAAIPEETPVAGDADSSLQMAEAAIDLQVSLDREALPLPDLDIMTAAVPAAEPDVIKPDAVAPAPVQSAALDLPPVTARAETPGQAAAVTKPSARTPERKARKRQAKAKPGRPVAVARRAPAAHPAAPPPSAPPASNDPLSFLFGG